MILIVCTDDPELEHVASASMAQYQSVFKSSYKIFHSELRLLGKSENLFIISHGAFQGDNDRPVIGDKAKAFYVNGDTLYLNVKSIFPPDYTGNVYIDACESADSTDVLLSFAQTFYLDFHPDSPTSKVFGLTGVSSGLIPLPDNTAWVNVSLENQ
ncbi:MULTISPECIES: hypothetical protein [Rahnella]|jgi:hypothetical protein|uniref:hypothetical protein n=2 Tax=Rahnella TaxID=34037 RepID=UPI000E64E9AE|nr:hypothetical protein [Rahnella sp. CG8]AYA05597.1 hypothetical protein D3Z09_03100 [Rahnella aquatilis]AZP49515.1 hypothetical protein EJP80_02795 [Rahnella aquatilis]MCM2448234.1 hypothetical protein [Rahnella sp. CG8]